MLDVDVPPSVASTDANLGDLTAVLQCARACDVLKPTMSAAAELLALAATDGATCSVDEAGIEHVEESDIVMVAQRLQEAFGVGMVAVTDGSQGWFATAGGDLVVPAFDGVKQVDATGAAFFRG